LKKALRLLSLFLLTSAAIHSQHPWQQIVMPKLKDVSSNFKNPPSEYGIVLWWGWDGPMTNEVIINDLNKIKSMGFQGVMIEAGYGMTEKYLSPGWFELVKFAVEQARIRGMHVWIEDEGKYPSGFAGGKFSDERPDLRMQGLVVKERIDVKNGEKISRKLSPETVSAVATNSADNSVKVLDLTSGELNWKAPEGNWKVILVEHQFRTAVTRSVNNPTRGKDATASLCDYLNPDATRQFIAWTHEQYKKYFGSEFGKTFMGIMGDEPDFGFTPWTPKILEEFKSRKGYDIKPYLALLFIPQPNDEAKRIKADYWDVWSSLFGENFFRIQADWCKENNIDYIVHLNHEEIAPALVKSEGDYFKNMRHVGVPGVDVIWSQIWMDHIADYPKLASSAAHLFGKPRAFTESFAAFTYRPSVSQAKWVLDYELVRGINSVQIMFMLSSANSAITRPSKDSASSPAIQQRRNSFFMTDSFPQVAKYFNRASYLLSIGRPTAQIAVYYPTSSMWLGDNDANTSCLAIVQKLMESQRDFDFVDEQALSSVLSIQKSGFRNLSGQTYSTIIIPSISVISTLALKRLKIFTKHGGKVIFLGRTPEMQIERTFQNASKTVDFSWATCEPSGELTSIVLNALPKADVEFDKSCPEIKYIHRKLADADLYFFFNEGTERQERNINLIGTGKVQLWDLLKGEIKNVTSVSNKNGIVRLPLNLDGWETKFILIGE